VPVPRTIDLNADVGESFGRWRLGDDDALLDVVTSANVACGFHAGDPATLVATCRAAAATAGLRTVREAFADRGYTAAGTLVPRSESGALLDDAPEVAARVLRLVREGRVTATDGAEVELEADSVCVHGDSPGAVAMARAVRDALSGNGVRLTAFAPPPTA
jgi:UPF0271 protein